MVREKNYGSWSSPISAAVVQRASVTYTYIFRDQSEESLDMKVFWLERRPAEQGRTVVISRDLSKETKCNEEWTPKEFNCCTRVHEYGGADCFVHSGVLYFSNEVDQCLYTQTAPQSPPVRVSLENNCRYANGFYSEKLKTIFIVREDHSKKDVVNTVVTIHDRVEKVLIQGADFYSSPKVSQFGDRICWVEWMFPNMPWDNTKVCVAKVDRNSLELVAGSLQVMVTGSDSDPISCILPCWTIYDNLCYISDENGYWNLWISENLENKTNLTTCEEDLANPLWCFDCSKYSYSSVRNELVVAKKCGNLEFIKCNGSGRRIVNFGEHLSSINNCQFIPDGSVVTLSHSSTTKKTIYRLWDDGRWEVLGQNREQQDVNPRYFSVPKHFKYPVGDLFSYGYYYPPCNPDFCAPTGTLPPLMIQAHGGPTSAASVDLNMKIQYLTSRGYAVFDVDYRGSTGYGKKYRHSLRGKWGVYDVEDCCAGAKYLSEMRLMDENMIGIRGGSAGGYTTLCCLTFTSVFKAGSSSYGIGDLKALLEDTHKFESRYLDLLVGDFTTQSHLYHERSAIHFPERITSPVIFFQGDLDPVVPMEQSKAMFEVIKKTGVPCALVIYEGERHGFKKIENIIHSMETEYYFFAKIFGFTTPDIEIPSITIENFTP